MTDGHSGDKRMMKGHLTPVLLLTDSYSNVVKMLFKNNDAYLFFVNTQLGLVMFL